MKICPECGFEGETESCPNDGATLVEATESEDIQQHVLPEPDDEEGDEDGLTSKFFTDSSDDEAPSSPAEADLNSDPEALALMAKARSGPKDPILNKTLAGRYQIVSRIGAGGMGVVYKARQAAMDRHVAVKVLLKDVASDESNIKRFHLEARAASRLVHPNTITIHDFGQTADGILYIVMEYLDGDSLDRVIEKDGRVHPARTIRIMKQICRSLAEAHGKGIIHRDLKPDNIFLNNVGGEPDFVKVLDFGVAKLKEKGGKGATLTQAGMIFGTPKYMSPEQAQGLELDLRSDVYALGVILYEMLMGKAPFEGESPISVLIKHVHDDPLPFAQVRDDLAIPVELEEVVFKALSKDPAGRIESAQALADALEECLPAAIQAKDALKGDGSDSSSQSPQGWSDSSPQVERTSQSGGGKQVSGGRSASGETPAGSGRVSLHDDEWQSGGAFSDEPLVPLPPKKEARPMWPIFLGVLAMVGLAGFGVYKLSQVQNGGPPAPTLVFVDKGDPSEEDGVIADAGIGMDSSSGEEIATAADVGSEPEEEKVDEGKAKRATAPNRKAPTPKQPASQEPKAKYVSLTLTSHPQGSAVWENGQKLVGTTPTVIKRQSGTIPLRLVFRKDGHQEDSHWVVLDRDRAVSAQLAPLARAPKPDTTAAPVSPALDSPSPSAAQREPVTGTKEEAPFKKFQELKKVDF